MKRIISSTLLITILSISAFAQKTLKGKVIDAATGKTLSGVTITYGGKSGNVTDNNGNFALDCSKASFIIVSHVGYESKSGD